MTAEQRAALRYMQENDIGATRTEIGWVWQSFIPLSEEAAEAIVEKYGIEIEERD